MNTEQYFLRLVAFESTSDEDAETVPSTPQQKVIAAEAAEMLREIGVPEVEVTDSGYVYGHIPATPGVSAEAVGFLAHLDTSSAAPGGNIHPRIIENYDGGDILLNEEKQITLSLAQFPYMAGYRGKRLIVTDGTTLLGGDDKAGVAEIMTLAEELLKSEMPHGEVDICFTPDEEIGRGVDAFEPEKFRAHRAYTVDGSRAGELEYENFNAATAKVTVHGVSIHPGGAKNKMVNAMTVAMQFASMLPPHEVPEATEGYEGFSHLTAMNGTVEQAELTYIIRDHDRAKLERRKERFFANRHFLNETYGAGTVEVSVVDTYSNMKEYILPHFEVVEIAKAAISDAGLTPIIAPIRGGTDGARLSEMGIPCPNLGTGSGNHHGRFEYAVVDEMEDVVRILLQIVRRMAQ